MEIVKAVVRADGTMEIETSGFEGEACEELVNSLLGELGSRESTQYSLEFYQGKKQGQSQQIRNKH